MKIRHYTALTAAAFAVSVGASSASAQETVTLTIEHFLPAQAPLPANFIAPWAEAVTEASGGRIQFEIYPAMQLGGSPASLYEQVSDGLIDIVWFLPGYTPGVFPKTEVFELPFISTNGEQTSEALWHYYEAELADEYPDVHMIAMFTHGPGLIHSNTPIASIDDMSGLTLRGPTRVTSWMLEALGASAVGMPVPQIPENLSRGVIDGAVVPWEVTGSIRLSELVNNHTQFSGDNSLYVATMIFAMNKDAYDALPDDLRAVIDEYSGLDSSIWAGRVLDEGDAGGLALAEAISTSNFITLDETETARWVEASASVYDRWIAEMDGIGIDGAALIEEARALIAEVTGGM